MSPTKFAYHHARHRTHGKKLTALAVLLHSCLTFGLSAADEALVRNGRPEGSIVVPKEASEQIHRSALLLQEYVKRSTGAVVPITTEAGEGVALHLGQTALAKGETLSEEALGRDGFILKRVDAENFLILGANDWGTEFGAYDFLEKFLGVRWLAATDLFTEVPTHETLLLPEGSVIEKPVYLHREFFPINIESDSKDPQVTKPLWYHGHDEAVRSGMPLWYHTNDLWGRFNRLRAGIDFHHHMRELLPPSKYVKSHPEFFPVFEGKRVIPPDDRAFQWQPNFSAPGIVEAAANEIIAYFEAHPAKESYSLGVNDSMRFDGSPESKARRSGRVNSIGLEDISDDYFEWTNDVADLVNRKFPDKKFGVLAYLQVLEPPTRVKVGPSIVPFITYENTRWFDPEYRERMQKVTRNWAEVSSQLGWYDYAYGSHYLIPRFFPHAEKEALVWGAANKVKYYFAEVIPAWGEGPNLWVLAKLLWNPHQDVDALLDQWYHAAVGEKATASLKAYFEIWEKFWRDEIRSSRWYSSSNLWQAFDNTDYLNSVPLALLDQCDRLLEETIRLTETPAQKQRAEALQKIWKVYRLSVITRRGNDLWKTANLASDKAIADYLVECRAAIDATTERLKLMGELVEDPLFGHTIYRSTSTNRFGDDWGASALWGLLPVVRGNAEVRQYLADLVAEGKGAAPVGYRASYGETIPMWNRAPEIARRVLNAADGLYEQRLEDGSFEEKKQDWQGLPSELSGEAVLEGASSLRVRVGKKGMISKTLPYALGNHFAKINVFTPKGVGDGAVTFTFTAYNDDGMQIGPLLPTATVPLNRGAWGSLVVPFYLGRYSLDATKLRVEVHFEGFADGDELFLDDMGVYRIDSTETPHIGVGPDGL